MFKAEQIKILGFPGKLNISILTVLQTIEKSKNYKNCIMGRPHISFLYYKTI